MKHLILFCLHEGVAGCCAKSTIAPLDRVKILLQARHKQYLNLGELSLFPKFLAENYFRKFHKKFPVPESVSIYTR